MKKILLLLTICILSMNALSALDESNLSEAEIQIEAQKDLAAILQYSVKYRFSPNLQVGDKIVYKRIKDPYEETDISIEVTKKDKNGVWIVEKFDDLEIHMLVDLEKMELVDFFGYDEDEIIPNPPLVTKHEMNNRINALAKFKDGLAFMSIPSEWKNKESKETIVMKSETLKCKVLEPSFSGKVTKKLDNEQKEMVKELVIFRAQITMAPVVRDTVWYIHRVNIAW